MCVATQKKVSWATDCLKEEEKNAAAKKHQQCDTTNGAERKPQFSFSCQGFILHRPWSALATHTCIAWESRGKKCVTSKKSWVSSTHVLSQFSIARNIYLWMYVYAKHRVGRSFFFVRSWSLFVSSAYSALLIIDDEWRRKCKKSARREEGKIYCVFWFWREMWAKKLCRLANVVTDTLTHMHRMSLRIVSKMDKKNGSTATVWGRLNLIAFAYIYSTICVIHCCRCLSQSLPFRLSCPFICLYNTHICLIWFELVFGRFLSFIRFVFPKIKYSPLVSQICCIYSVSGFDVCEWVFMLWIDIDTAKWDANEQQKEYGKEIAHARTHANLSIVAKMFLHR